MRVRKHWSVEPRQGDHLLLHRSDILVAGWRYLCRRRNVHKRCKFIREPLLGFHTMSRHGLAKRTIIPASVPEP